MCRSTNANRHLTIFVPELTRMYRKTLTLGYVAGYLALAQRCLFPNNSNTRDYNLVVGDEVDIVDNTDY